MRQAKAQARSFSGMACATPTRDFLNSFCTRNNYTTCTKPDRKHEGSKFICHALPDGNHRIAAVRLKGNIWLEFLVCKTPAF